MPGLLQRLFGHKPQPVLAQAEKKQAIVDAMNRPAEAVKMWFEYRPIFNNDARVAGGVAESAVAV